jgi:hypothetical protein
LILVNITLTIGYKTKLSHPSFDIVYLNLISYTHKNYLSSNSTAAYPPTSPFQSFLANVQYSYVSGALARDHVNGFHADGSEGSVGAGYADGG